MNQCWLILVLPLDILVKIRHFLCEKCKKSDCPLWVKTWLLQLICAIFWDAGWCPILLRPWTVYLHPLLGGSLPPKKLVLQFISFCEGGSDLYANRKNCKGLKDNVIRIVGIFFRSRLTVNSWILPGYLKSKNLFLSENRFLHFDKEVRAIYNKIVMIIVIQMLFWTDCVFKQLI